MADYQKMYYVLFNAMSESVETMMKAMQMANDIYMDTPETIIVLGKKAQDVDDSGSTRS